MFQLSFVTLVVFAASAVVTFLVRARKLGRLGDAIKNWLLFIDGAVIIAVVFFFQPWIKTTPLS